MAATQVLNNLKRLGTALSASLPVQAGGNQATARVSNAVPDIDDPNNEITLTIQGSFDNGHTWMFIASTTWVGGQTDRNGDPIPPNVSASLPDPPPGRVRLVVDSTKEQNYSADLEVLT